MRKSRSRYIPNASLPRRRPTFLWGRHGFLPHERLLGRITWRDKRASACEATWVLGWGAWTNFFIQIISRTDINSLEPGQWRESDYWINCESIFCLMAYQCKWEQGLMYSLRNLTGDWCFIYFSFQEPCVKNDDRMLGWVCCPSGQLYATARIDRSAYCPGQEVRITGHVSNQSGKQVIGTEVQLIQKALYKAPHGKCVREDMRKQ